MSTLLNIIYREYFRARLAEMRQPTLLPAGGCTLKRGAAPLNASYLQ